MINSSQHIFKIGENTIGRHKSCNITIPLQVRKSMLIVTANLFVPSFVRQVSSSQKTSNVHILILQAVSKKHACIFVHGTNHFICDCKSRNKTRRNQVTRKYFLEHMIFSDKSNLKLKKCLVWQDIASFKFLKILCFFHCVFYHHLSIFVDVLKT